MAWYTWQSQEDFDTWHEEVKTQLGLPMPGKNAHTGEVDESAQWTTDYTSVTEVGPGDFRAFVEDRVAQMTRPVPGGAEDEVEVIPGLGTLSEAPPAPELDAI